MQCNIHPCAGAPPANERSELYTDLTLTHNGVGRVGLSMALRACRAPDHENEAKASSTVVARRGARIPRVFPTALFTLDEGRLPRLSSSVSTPV